MTSVHFLGSGDAFGSGGRLQTCILVTDGEWQCLVDCGTTALVGLKGADIEPANIDAIVVTHLHGDHFGGLPFFLLDAQFNSRRSTPLIIAGHRDLEQRLPAAMEVLFPGSVGAFDMVPTHFVALQPGSISHVGPARVEVFEVEHSCGSPPFAVRLTTPSGAVVGYSGDTEWTEALVQAAEGCDLFIAEAYFHDKRVKWHLDYVTLLRERSRLDARRLIATHMSAELLDRVGSLEIDVAHDGLVVDL